VARCSALGWSQNELARRIGKDSGLVSRVLNGQVTSGVVWRLIAQALETAESLKAQGLSGWEPAPRTRRASAA
jgi:transcriptional regulator with XRE-family HTH domain